MKRALYLLLGALSMLASLELLLLALPVSTSTRTGYHIHPDILTNPPHHRWTMATGWDLRNVQHMRSNNHGFAAEHDFVSGSGAIGLVGDSYVEAAMLPWADRPAAQLERALGGQRAVYAMGGPGSSLLDYAVRIRWAHQTLGLTDFVVLMESTDATQAVCGSGNVHARCLDAATLMPVTRHRPPSGVLTDVLRGSAMAQYLVSQLKFSPSRLTQAGFWSSGAPAHGAAAIPAAVAPTAARPALSAQQQAIVERAVEAFQAELQGLNGLRLLFVIDMNRRNLEAGVQRADEGYHVEQRLRAAGHAVVRGEAAYREHQKTSPLRLDMGPHDGHLNALGVALLMKSAARAMQEQTIPIIQDRGN